jgi:hypothetical protein
MPLGELGAPGVAWAWPGFAEAKPGDDENAVLRALGALRDDMPWSRPGEGRRPRKEAVLCVLSVSAVRLILRGRPPTSARR